MTLAGGCGSAHTHTPPTWRLMGLLPPGRPLVQGSTCERGLWEEGSGLVHTVHMCPLTLIATSLCASEQRMEVKGQGKLPDQRGAWAGPVGWGGQCPHSWGRWHPWLWGHHWSARPSFAYCPQTLTEHPPQQGNPPSSTLWRGAPGRQPMDAEGCLPHRDHEGGSQPGWAWARDPGRRVSQSRGVTVVLEAGG